MKKVKVSVEEYKNEASMRSAFLSDIEFEAGTQTPIRSSKITSDVNGNKGKTLLTFKHSKSKRSFTMSLGEYRDACEEAGIVGIDGEGNVLEMNSVNLNKKYQILP